MRGLERGDAFAWLLLPLLTVAVSFVASPANAGLDSVTVIAAGDVAGSGAGAALTAALVARIPGEVAALGDLAYDDGSTWQFNSLYEPTWGRFKQRTHPAPGNHEYIIPNAGGYFRYFGTLAGPPGKGWYGYHLGAYWHGIALNSNYRAGIGVDKASEQYAWLEAELARNAARHIIAYWHHPRFSSGPHGDNAGMDDIWRLLYRHRVDIVLAGHDHDYERFMPLDDQGRRDDELGIHSFVVGTGGKSHTPLMMPWWPKSVIRDNGSYGVLKLTLDRAAYRWDFLPVAGRSFRDGGAATCHALPKVPVTR